MSPASSRAATRAPEHGGVAFQIPRNTLALLMISQAVVIVPHAWQLSPWIIAVGLFCGFWRTMVYQGRWNYPKPWVKGILVITSGLTIAWGSRFGMSLEAASSLLIVSFSLKLIEMKTRRDAYIVIFLCYFTIATEFLFVQSIPLTVFEFLAFIVVTAAMIGLNQLHSDARPGRSIKVAASLTLQALPLMLVLFVFFPRIAPLWSVPLPSSAKTGISEVVQPGDIANLIQSDEIAMRVIFEDAVPSTDQLYWRGMVYSDYRSGAWRARSEWQRGDSMPDQADAPALEYVVLQQPTAAKWLFALDVATTREPGIGNTEDRRLVAREPLHSVMRYQVRSYLDATPDVHPAAVDFDRETMLPRGDNPRLRQFAANLDARAGSPSAFVDAVLSHIRREPFVYTLRPPPLTEPNGLDQFWFETRRGFCSHYASAFTFMMRSVGIPARMVGGYQGGELNPLGRHMVVRQYDAHAWVEVWLQGSGWVRVDPTFAVAPARIQRGLRSALPATELESLSPFSNARLSNLAMFENVFHFLDSIEHQWTLWVIGYDANAQSQYLASLLGTVTPMRVAMALLVTGGISMGMVAIVLLWRRRPRDENPVVRQFRVFAARLERFGYRRDRHESPAAYVHRIARLFQVSDDVAAPVIERLESLLYNPSGSVTTAQVRDLKRALRKLQLQLLLTT